MEVNKPQTPHSHKPYGKDGSGFYSDNTIGCYNVVKETEELLLKTVEGWQDLRETFSIADYGTADGGTSMPVLHALIRKMRLMCGDDLPIHIMYEDQPFNDFKSLFLRLQGLISGPPSYYLSEKNVYVSACGTGFYSQCFPPNYVHVGLSATSMHWLSGKPCNITGSLHHTMISNAEEKASFASWAAKDWKTILLHRASELKQGGHLVLAQFCVDNEGFYLGKTSHIKNSMHEVMRDLWLQMAEEGKITKDEFNNTTFINYYRTVAEYRAPFDNPESEVFKSGLRLVSIETKVVRCPYHLKWLKEGGDPVKHARWYVPTTRTWSNQTFLSGLASSRSEEEKLALVDEFFSRYEHVVAKNPADHGMDYVHAYIVIKKV